MFTRLFAVMVVVLAAASAPGTVRETQVLNAVDSNGGINSPANQIRTFTLAGGYTLGRINLAGTLTAVHTATWPLDSRIVVTAPNGATYTFQPFDDNTPFSSMPFNVNTYIPIVGDPAGLWTLRFYEYIDNGGTAQVDARWNITLSFTDEPAPPPTPVTNGSLGSLLTTTLSRTNALASRQVNWYTFSLSCDARPEIGSYLDLDLIGSTIFGTTIPNDTEIALYSATGDLIVTDDDSGPGAAAQFSFGTGGRAAVNDGLPFDGQSGALAAGTYWIATSAYNSLHGPLIWAVTAPASATGTIVLAVRPSLGTGTAPSITQHPAGATREPGESVTFTVAATGATSFRWSRNGVTLQDGPAPGGGVISGATTSAVTVTGVAPIDQGDYRSTVWNACALRISNAASLVVETACDGDVNCDFALDGFDVEVQEKAVGGDMTDYCQADPDFNGDFALDGFDVEAVEVVVGGGPCP